MSEQQQHAASTLAGTWVSTSVPSTSPIWIIPQSDDVFEVRMPGWFPWFAWGTCCCLGAGPSRVFTRVQGMDNTFQCTDAVYCCTIAKIQQTTKIVKLSATNPYDKSKNIINIDGKIYVRTS
ncbi:hypothetical protein TrLO_g8199 [Triparma laevis f. longispina]|uniref:Uncharacterized protein n=1 Tax=Triparma laevis f. longispina TaxID=1714387 RepID=A0A9W6ZA50_9STRA|nr:hypothetical protein TrLO_g8199 [Triparma laevis f. longispina]